MLAPNDRDSDKRIIELTCCSKCATDFVQIPDAIWISQTRHNAAQDGPRPWFIDRSARKFAAKESVVVKRVLAQNACDAALTPETLRSASCMHSAVPRSKICRKLPVWPRNIAYLAAALRRCAGLANDFGRENACLGAALHNRLAEVASLQA